MLKTIYFGNSVGVYVWAKDETERRNHVRIFWESHGPATLAEAERFVARMKEALEFSHKIEADMALGVPIRL
jgi:hypothetical protein